MHPFDEWFAHAYPDPQPPGTRDTTLIAWNAAVHAACESIWLAKDGFAFERRYDEIAAARNLREEVRQLARRLD